MFRCSTPLLALAATATLAFGSDVAPVQQEAAPPEAEIDGVKMPVGPMLQKPIAADSQEAAVVPEPVLASILAASAVIFLRRSRR